MTCKTVDIQWFLRALLINATYYFSEGAINLIKIRILEVYKQTDMYFTYVRNIFLSLLFLALIFGGTSKFTGSPGGKTGSPADGSNCTGCHNDFDIINKASWISTNIPETGYIPGTTYEIKIDAYHEGSTRIGFEITSETAKAKVGKWALADTIKTQFITDSLAVTHTSKGTVAADSVHWTMKWTAPDAANGDVVFYAAVNATNSDISSAGDQVYLTSTRVKEEGTAGIDDVLEAKHFIRVWPNPAKDYLNVSFKEGIDIGSLEIINLEGSVLKAVYRLNKRQKISLENIPKGILFLRVQVAKKIYVQPFIKY